MDQEPDLIKEQMAETRVSLTDKIEKLEDTLKENVETALHTATGTVENVTEKVEETVEHRISRREIFPFGDPKCEAGEKTPSCERAWGVFDPVWLLVTQ